ncbi:transposase IS116/IS110/IS902 [Proteiniborus sp. DW1]|nr:transposase IS116/IS110/IS902 [Proteiniborus sp. DW1]
MSFRPIARIDVGKFFSEMAILSPSNEVIARMKIKHDSCSDFERTLGLLKKVEKDFASRAFIVIESTGHYHKTLFHSLCKNGFEVSIINPIQSNSIKILELEK